MNLQETLSNKQIQENLHSIEYYLEEKKGYDPQHGEALLYEGLKPSIRRDIQNTLGKLSLGEVLMRVGSSNVGSGGFSSYLIPTALSKTLYAGCTWYDKVPLFSADIIKDPQGDSGVVAAMWNLKPTVSGGMTIPDDTGAGSGSSWSLKKLSLGLRLTNELLEDQQYGLIDWQVKNAGAAIGKTATTLALTKFLAAADGYGTLQTLNSTSSGTTAIADVAKMVEKIATGQGTGHPQSTVYHPDLMITSSLSWFDQLCQTFHFNKGGGAEPTGQYDFDYGGLNTLVIDSAALMISATKGYTIIADKMRGLVTVRKSWMRVENFADPLNDLSGAVVTGRQDSVTIANSAVGVITET